MQLTKGTRRNRIIPFAKEKYPFRNEFLLPNVGAVRTSTMAVLLLGVDFPWPIDRAKLGLSSEHLANKFNTEDWYFHNGELEEQHKESLDEPRTIMRRPI